LDQFAHRNGKWRNVENSSPQKNGDDIAVFSIRDIKEGEILYLSVSDCSEGCEEVSHTYITHEVFKDKGIVEQYPQRWALGSREQLLVEIDADDETGDKSLTWLFNRRPGFDDLIWLQSQANRLERMEDEIMSNATALESAHERTAIVNYFNAYKDALHLAFVYRDDGFKSSAEYDPLVEPKGPAVEGHNALVCDRDPTPGGFQETYSAQSQYQSIDFKYNTKIDNTCMFLSNWLQTCSVVRPHYHEAFVHVAGQYVDKVKRVVYLGGGDNMILHEILKFPDLELVVGMELDQQVCRSAYQYLGTLPYFDDPRVQWWFGDATKTLLALPESYFGSFDLVLVDLQTFVADALKVTEKLSIMDTAILLMKQDGGVIAKNEDFSVRTNTGFAKYTVDLEYHDLPRFCQQSITLGSNSIDFMTAEPKSHGVETLAVDLVGARTFDPFHAWFGYRQTVPNSCAVEHEVEPPKNCTEEDSGTSAGIFLVLEAEKVTLSLDSMSEVQSALSKTIKDLGLSEVAVSNSSDFDKKVMVFILNEGYITARVFPEAKYIGFDVHLWSTIDHVDKVKEGLVSGVGGDLEKFTSFRFVTSGMHGLDFCEKNMLTEVAVDAQKTICDKNTDPSSKGNLIKDSHDVILQQLVQHMSIASESTKEPIVIGIMCGEQLASCTSASAVKTLDSKTTKVVPLSSCKSLKDMSACEKQTFENLEAAVAESKKMDALILDEEMPFEMGQIIEKLFSDKVTHSKIMEKSHLVLSQVPAGEKWRQVLLDRFRSDFMLFDPAHRANLKFSAQGEGSVEWCLFSSGDKSFFNHLSSAISVIEARTELKPAVEEVENGLINEIADFKPTKVFKNRDYDKTRSLSQWSSQTAVGHQTYFQMTVTAPKTPVYKDEEVLVQMEPGPWDLVYGKAVVLVYNKDSEGKEYILKFLFKKGTTLCNRDEIRKFSDADKDPSSIFEMGDLVLYEYEPGFFQNGVVTRRDEVGTYAIYLLNTDGQKLYNVPRSSLLLQFESTGFVTEATKLTTTDVLGAFGYGINTAMLKEGEETSLIGIFEIGSGVVLTTFWNDGHAILKWDGQNRLEVNIFTYYQEEGGRTKFQEAFISQLDFLQTLARDEHPRGYGSIVNFENEIATDPYWVKQMKIQ
jgi:spermidine synthase